MNLFTELILMVCKCDVDVYYTVEIMQYHIQKLCSTLTVIINSSGGISLYMAVLMVTVD